MPTTFIIGARGRDLSRSMDFIAIIAVSDEEQLNRRLQDIIKRRSNLGNKTLLLQVMDDFMVQFSKSRIKTKDMFLTSPSLSEEDKKKILDNEWLSINQAREVFRKNCESVE